MGEEEDVSALHARIFGSDDDDDDDEPYVAPAESSSRKRISKSKPASSGKKRRSAPDADEMAAAGRESEEQRLARRAEKEARREARRADGGGAEGDDDPDEDSVDGDEAVEEGSKKDIDRLLKKNRSGKKEYSRQQLKEDVEAMQERLEAAADKDETALNEEPPKPAVFKAAMIGEVVEFMQKRHYHEVMVDIGFLTTLARWLKPTNDGALVSLTVRTGLLKCLSMIEADDTLVGALRSSKIGVYVKLLSLHRRETDDNKRAARALVEKWSRPIFNSQVAFRSQDVETVAPRFSVAELAAQAERKVAEAGPAAVAPPQQRSGMTGRGTVVPRPLGMDFHAQPASSAVAKASAKYSKESTKGKLQEKMIGSKKTVNQSRQASTLSVEGRTLDRV